MGDGEYGRLDEGAEEHESCRTYGHSLPLHGEGEKWSATFSSAEVRCLKMTMMPIYDERRWVLLKIPRCDIDGVGEGK